jgi:hypothetical protein
MMNTQGLSASVLIAVALTLALARPGLAACGDGVVDGSEQCDLGAGNGSPTTCCTTLCEFRAEDNACRPAVDACDVTEFCTGESDACPANVIIPEGASCNDGSPCTFDDRCFSGVCSGTPTPDTCIDDFLCYKVGITAGTPPFTPIPSVNLVDDFENENHQVLKPRHLCTPANKNAEGTLDAVTHGKTYRLRGVPGSPRHVPQTNIKVTNQIGSIRLDTIRPDLLFVPTAKSLVSSPTPPNPASHRVDHYKCYKVRVTRGTPKFPDTVFVSATDQFTNTARQFRLKKPRHFCTAVDKNGEGVDNPLIHILCYSAKGRAPKHQKQIGVFVNNQFGPLRVNTIKEHELCIPSSKSLSPSGAFLDTGAALFD